MALLLKIVAVLASLYALAFLGSYFLQRRLIYYPDPARIDPGAAGLTGVDERVIATPDGEKLIAWNRRPRPGMPTLLYFHGNAGSLATRAERFGRYAGRGYGMLMLSYRGYSGSTGQPSERRNVADAMLAYDALVAEGTAPNDIVVYGESLGTGVAVQVAAERRVAGVILDAPYTSLVDLAEMHYPRLPARTFMTDRYDTLRHLPRVTVPLLVVHGSEDRLVPVHMGRAVHAAARSPKEIAVVRGAGHSDHASFGSNEIIYDWIARLRTGSIPRAEVQAAE